MEARTKVALGVLGGYVLGRGKRSKFALLALGYLAAKQGSRQLETAKSSILESDEGKAFTQQLTGGLATAAKGAATAAAGKGVHSVSQNLKQRTALLQEGSGSSEDEGPEEASEDEQDSESRTEETDDSAESPEESDEADAPDDAEDATPEKKPAAESASRSTGSSTRKSTSGATRKTPSSSTKKTASSTKSRSTGKSPSRSRSTSSSTKKSTGGTAKRKDESNE